MEGLEDELTCPVCLDLYTCPVLLPCHHNLCYRCAEVCLKTPSRKPVGAQAACSPDPDPSPPKTKPTGFACPTCREEVHLGDRGVDGLRRNLLLQNIIDRFKQIHAQSQSRKNTVPCLVCDATPPRDAVKSCPTCKLSYCGDCLPLRHPSLGVLANHQLAAPVESFDDLQKIVMCPDHKNKPVELYCTQDNTPVCSLCKLVGKHKEHDVAALEEVFDGKKSGLQKVIDEVGTKVEEETVKIKELETKKTAIANHTAQVKSQIQTECDELTNIIQERKVAMLKRADAVAQADTARIQTFITSCQETVKVANASLAFAKEAVKECDPACFLQSEQVVRARVQKSSSTFVEDDEYKHIPTDRVSVDMSSIKSLLQNLKLPQEPVVLTEKCSTTAEGAVVEWESDDRDACFNVLLDSIACTVINNGNSCNITNLKENTTYAVTVVTKANSGKSKSDNITFKTKSRCCQDGPIYIPTGSSSSLPLRPSRPLTAAEQPSQPLTAAVRQPQPFVEALRLPQPFVEAVRQPQPLTAAGRQSQPLTAAVRQPQPFVIVEAVRQPQPFVEAVRQPQPLTAAGRQSQPFTEAVRQPQSTAAVRQPRPFAEFEAVRQPRPFAEAVRQPRPLTAAGRQSRPLVKKETK